MNTEHVPREVIEGKLLAALDDEGKVAIILSQQDLGLLIQACLAAAVHSRTPEEMERFTRMKLDLQELYRPAFTKGE